MDGRRMGDGWSSPRWHRGDDHPSPIRLPSLWLSRGGLQERRSFQQLWEFLQQKLGLARKKGRHTRLLQGLN